MIGPVSSKSRYNQYLPTSRHAFNTHKRKVRPFGRHPKDVFERRMRPEIPSFLHEHHGLLAYHLELSNWYEKPVKYAHPFVVKNLLGDLDTFHSIVSRRVAGGFRPVALAHRTYRRASLAEDILIIRLIMFQLARPQDRLRLRRSDNPASSPLPLIFLRVVRGPSPLLTAPTGRPARRGKLRCGHGMRRRWGRRGSVNGRSGGCSG